MLTYIVFSPGHLWTLRLSTISCALESAIFVGSNWNLGYTYNALRSRFLLKFSFVPFMDAELCLWNSKKTLLIFGLSVQLNPQLYHHQISVPLDFQLCYSHSWSVFPFFNLISIIYGLCFPCLSIRFHS